LTRLLQPQPFWQSRSYFQSLRNSQSVDEDTVKNVVCRERETPGPASDFSARYQRNVRPEHSKQDCLKCGYSYLHIMSPLTAALPLKTEEAEDPSDDYNIDGLAHIFIDLNFKFLREHGILELHLVWPVDN
jgi:hypothetical protein